MPRGVEERDAAEHRRARAARERLHHRWRDGAFGGDALHGRLLDLALPVLRLEAADELAGALAHRVAILAERVEVDLLAELGDVRALHAHAEVRPVAAEPLHPRLVEDLVAPREHWVEDDVLHP